MPFLKFYGQHYYFSQASKYSTIILSKSPAIFYEINFHQDMQVKPMAMCHFNILCSDKKIRSVNCAFNSFKISTKKDNK